MQLDRASSGKQLEVNNLINLVIKIYNYPCQCSAQLSHGLVEGDVLENLDPGDKDADSRGILESLGPDCQESKVSVDFRFGQQSFQELIDNDILVDVEANRSARNLKQRNWWIFSRLIEKAMLTPMTKISRQFQKDMKYSSLLFLISINSSMR